MYDFVEVTETPSGKKRTLNTTFGGITLDDLFNDSKQKFETLTVSGRSNVNNRIGTLTPSGMDGLIEFGGKNMGERVIVVKYSLSTKTDEAHEQAVIELNSCLNGEKKRLMFGDEDVYYIATMLENEIPEENSRELIGYISFLCSDPYKHGQQKTYTGTSAVTIQNKGTAPTYPKTTVTLKKDAAYVAISDGHDINMVGNYGNVDETPFKREERVFWDEMGTTEGWVNTSAVEEGDISGTMKANGYAFYTDDYGTGTRWHGPALKKSIGPTLQDFQVDALVRQQGSHGQVGSVEIALLDANNRFVGKMVMTKRSANNQAVWARMIAGNLARSHDILNSRGSADWVWARFNGMLRIGRVGNRWYAYVARYSDGRYHTSMSTSWIDRQGGSTAPIAQIQVQIWKHNAYPATTTQTIDDVKVYKINSEPDGVPYVGLKDDVFVFDHENDVIYRNGEVITKEKAFIGNYFDVRPGINILTAEPEDAIENIEVEFIEKYI